MTKIDQFSIGGQYNSSQLKDLARDGRYNLSFPSKESIGESVATIKKNGKLIASFLLIRKPDKDSNVYGYQRIY
jgi:hypothetical protein